MRQVNIKLQLLTIGKNIVWQQKQASARGWSIHILAGE